MNPTRLPKENSNHHDRYERGYLREQEHWQRERIDLDEREEELNRLVSRLAIVGLALVAGVALVLSLMGGAQ